jgi:ATP-dependent helicase/nuclease subunit A
MSEQAAYRINGEPVSREAFYAVACDPARSVAVEACAGAGKTWMLVSRILRALLDGTAPQDILAITFTKKAAGEMRERLLDWLLAFSRLPQDQLVQELALRGMDPAQAAVRAGDLQALHTRLTALGRSVQIRTFHSWFAALLRNAPLSVLHDLELPAPYELLEDDKPAVQRVWPRFYAAVAADAGLRQDYLHSVALHGRHQTGEALKNALNKRVEFALADASGVVESSVEPFAALYPSLARFDAPEDALLGSMVRERWLAWAKVLGGEGNKTPQKAANAVVDAFAVPDEPGQMAVRFAQLRKAFFVADEDRLTNHLCKFPAAQEAEAELKDLCGARRQHQAWQHHQRLTRLTRCLSAEYASLKRERGWVDMNDIEGAALRLLGDAELSGWMQQRLDARVRHLLIDEFQDTNPLQWQALYGWLSAYAGAGPGEAPRVFLVGDPKQSIYRFRRAEPQVFKAAQAFVVEGLDGALLTCDHTRRCATGVVDALNAVMQAAEQDAGYAGYRTHTTESDALGAVLALPQVPRAAGGNDDHGAEGETVWRDSLSEPRVTPEETLSAIEARQAADWIAHELAGGALKPRDIMVLSRKRERLGWLFEALRERGIACEQPEKLDLADAPAVQDVVALLDALVSPAHDLSLARALRSPLLGLGDASLAQIARLRKRWTPPAEVNGPGEKVQASCWWDVLQRWSSLESDEQDALAASLPGGEAQDLHPIGPAAIRLARWRGWVDSLPPHDALTAICRDGDVLARFAQAVPPHQREAVLAQLQSLLAHTLAQDGGRFLSPYRLVRAFKAGDIRAPQAAQDNAVRLLTIHGAKGLEAHTVLLLDTDAAPPKAESMGVLVDWPGEAPQPRRFVFLASEKSPPACAEGVLAIEQQARALEELNALYVALTRAEHRLVISSTEPHRAAVAPSWFRRIQAHALAVAAAPESVHAEAAEPEPFELRALPVFVPAAASEDASGQETTENATLDALARTGLALHRLLQWRPTPLGGFEWTDLHRQAVAREFALSPEQSAQAHTMARAIVSGEAAWAWDADQLTHWGNEVELWFEGQLLRLDRLVRRRDSGEWWVLDHKSAERPEQQAQLLAHMVRYRRAVQTAQPGAVVRLAFINANGQLIELPAETETR